MSENNTDLIIYQTEDGETKIDVHMENETVWLSLDQMAELFQRDKSTISRHIKNIFDLERNGAARVLLEGELSGDSLRGAILSGLGDRESLLKMRDCSLKLGQRDACAKIYAIVKDLVD